MNKIQELRERAGWTQDELAAQLKTVRQTIGHYETGARGLNTETILRLCDIFGCTADYLLGRSSTGGLKLSPEEESLILAHRRADGHTKDLVRLALEPFWQDGSYGKETASA